MNQYVISFLLPAISGLVGAVIGGATVLLSTYINHRHLEKKELEALRRSRGEETLADIGALIAWGTTIIVDAIDGKLTTELPSQKFRVWTNVELYYSEHIPLMIALQKKLTALSGIVVKSAQAIQADRAVIIEQSKVMLDAEKDLIRSSDLLRKALIAELRWEPKKSGVAKGKNDKTETSVSE